MHNGWSTMTSEEKERAWSGGKKDKKEKTEDWPSYCQ